MMTMLLVVVLVFVFRRAHIRLALRMMAFLVGFWLGYQGAQK